jgi:ketopantoate hydroxymethyltransferase
MDKREADMENVKERLYHGVAVRRGKKKALVAAGRELLTVCYSMLKNQRPYFNPLHVQA